MAIFNKEYTLFLLNEMKTKEEYSRRSFKKKYNFKPDKPGSNTGEITVDGKKYKVDMKDGKYDLPANVMKAVRNATYEDMKNTISKDAAGVLVNSKHKSSTKSDVDDKNGKIILDKKFFKLKGSNNNERRDAILQHEVGHHKDKNRYYMDNDGVARIHAHRIARKYNNDTVNDNEFIADRHSANHISEKANKNALKNYMKLNKKEIEKENYMSEYKDKNGKIRISDDKEKKDKINDYNSKAMSQMKQRFKALKDPELRKYKNL